MACLAWLGLATFAACGGDIVGDRGGAGAAGVAAAGASGGAAGTAGVAGTAGSAGVAAAGAPGGTAGTAGIAGAAGEGRPLGCVEVEALRTDCELPPAWCSHVCTAQCAPTASCEGLQATCESIDAIQAADPDLWNCLYTCIEAAKPKWTCGDGRVILEARRCDGIPDCLDGTDEVGCG